ncbi:MAG: altronate dehydratase family protein [Bacteroidota bacterium]
MLKPLLQIHPADNILVCLRSLTAGELVEIRDGQLQILEDIPAKHKCAARDFTTGELLIMYGLVVGKTLRPIAQGCKISTKNVTHHTGDYQLKTKASNWKGPSTQAYQGQTFMGYHRADGRVGTRNYWLVVPLVFCENRNIQVIREAMEEKLGYASERDFSIEVETLIQLYQNGATTEELQKANILRERQDIQRQQLFPNVDGIRFLQHEGGCGGIRQDAESLCRLLAGYITHPNVAGATVLSLGCQNAQITLLQDAIQALQPKFTKPLYILEQQQSKSERTFIANAVKQTFIGLMTANRCQRQAADLSHLCLGLECGGSDGFSGITANPALGYTTDLLIALGAKAILAEFPELNGVEQALIHRCRSRESAEKFVALMRTYARRAQEAGSGFDQNPSPGNIKDGLITDAMKSAGAARKGGSSPVVAVLDYTEPATEPGLNLLCTPGNDVESTTGLAGSGANLIVFTTGLGTPTGNPICPTIKMSSNTELAQRMSDLIDIDAGTIISGQDSIESKGEELLKLLIRIASGEVHTQAERLGQYDFIPWKRGISL